EVRGDPPRPHGWRRRSSVVRDSIREHADLRRGGAGGAPPSRRLRPGPRDRPKDPIGRDRGRDSPLRRDADAAGVSDPPPLCGGAGTLLPGGGTGGDPGSDATPLVFRARAHVVFRVRPFPRRGPNRPVAGPNCMQYMRVSTSILMLDCYTTL